MGRTLAALILALTVAGLPIGVTAAQKSTKNKSRGSQTTKANALLPVDYRTCLERLRNHPGFYAEIDMYLFIFHQRIKVARVPGKLWTEFYLFESKDNVSPKVRSYATQLITVQGRPTYALDPQAKIYTEVPSGVQFGPVISFEDFLDQAAKVPVVRMQDIGETEFEGRRVRRYQLTMQDEQTKVEVLYDASGLEDLPVGIRVPLFGGEISLYLRKTTLNVPESFFQVPECSRRVTFEEFKAELLSHASSKAAH